MSEDSFEVPKALSGTGSWIDDRFGAARGTRVLLRKVFPDHWSFMLGEIALWSFVILLLTGTFLALFFTPSMAPVVYHGSYAKLDGLTMSQAYQSTLNISFDVRGGLLMRQIHHWAADLFMAAIMAHMLRVFFTGAYRKPREINWLIGIGLFTLGLLEGLFGYSLPDDQLSGAGLRVLEGILQGIPIVGTYLAFFLFGGPFPGDSIIPRMYILHVLLIPGLILALITAHLFIMVHQKHTQMPGKGRTERNVVGQPLFPYFMAKGGSLVLLHLRRAGPAGHLRPDQPHLAVRALLPAGHLLRLPARLLHGPARRLAADHAGLGVELPRAHHHVQCADPVRGAADRGAGRSCVLAVLRTLGDRGQGLPQHQRPAAERADPHRDRHGRRRVLRGAVARGRQRRYLRQPLDPAVHDYLDRPGHGVRGAGDRVLRDPAYLHSLAAQGPGRAAARL